MTDLKSDNARGQAGEVGRAQSTADEFCFPHAHSVKGRVLGSLLRGERITHKDCWFRFGSSRLSHHILKLRQSGWSVEMDWENAKTSDAGRVAQIGRYWLSQEVIDAAGDIGQQYAAECAHVEAERRAA